jgi:hypothetical protein
MKGSATVALSDGRRWRDGRDWEDLVFVHVQARAVNQGVRPGRPHKPPKIRAPQILGPAVNPQACTRAGRERDSKHDLIDGLR